MENKHIKHLKLARINYSDNVKITNENTSKFDFKKIHMTDDSRDEDNMNPSYSIMLIYYEFIFYKSFLKTTKRIIG